MIRSGGMEERRVREGERSSFFFFRNLLFSCVLKQRRVLCTL
jgi:hypothetical protein